MQSKRDDYKRGKIPVHIGYLYSPQRLALNSGAAIIHEEKGTSYL